MRLKRWESPRREGRNDKGRGGSARQRQLKKQQQVLRKRLKEGNQKDNNNNNKKGGEKKIFPLIFCVNTLHIGQSMWQKRDNLDMKTVVAASVLLITK